MLAWSFALVDEFPFEAGLGIVLILHKKWPKDESSGGGLAEHDVVCCGSTVGSRFDGPLFH